MVGGDNPNQSPERGERGRAASEDAGVCRRFVSLHGLGRACASGSFLLPSPPFSTVDQCEARGLLVERCENTGVLEGCPMRSVLVDDALRAWKVSFPGASRSSSLYSNNVDAVHLATGTFFPRFRVGITDEMVAAVLFGNLHGSVVLWFRVVQVLLTLRAFVKVPD